MFVDAEFLFSQEHNMEVHALLSELQSELSNEQVMYAVILKALLLFLRRAVLLDGSGECRACCLTWC